MTNRKAAALSGALLARKGAARPAGFSDPIRRDFTSDDLKDSILEPAEVDGSTGDPTDGAPLASELLNIRPFQPGLSGESTALRAGPRPGTLRWWGRDAEVTEISPERRKAWKRIRWRLTLAGAAILAALLAGLYGRGVDRPEAAQDAAAVSSAPTAGQSIIQAGQGTARAALPPLAVSDAPPLNTDSASLVIRTTLRPQEFATLPAAQVRGVGGPAASVRGVGDLGPIRAGIGLTAATPRAKAASNEASAAAPAKAQVLVDTPQVVPPREARVAALRTEVATRLPQHKPDSPLIAFFTGGGNGVFVQLGSLKTAVGAMREWDKLVEEFPGVLSGRPLQIEQVALTNRGAFYRIRTGPISGITRARAICAEFAARDRGCLVVRR